MSLENNFEIQKTHTEEGYLSNYCEKIFLLKNCLEKKQFKDFPDRMVFETAIWMVGEELRQEIKKSKKILNDLLLKEIIKIIQIKKYLTGRESFVMLLHYFKKNPNIEIYLVSLLDDEQLYAFAIGELTKLKLFDHTDKVQEILSKEKISWRKKEAKKYIEKSKNR